MKQPLSRFLFLGAYYAVNANINEVAKYYGVYPEPVEGPEPAGWR